MNKKNKRHSKINILFLTRGLFIGGAELVINNICNNLNKEIYNISVCYLKLNGPIGEKLSKNGIDVFGLPKGKKFDFKYLSFLKLAKIIKNKNIHLVHSHDMSALFDSASCKMILPGIKLLHTFHYGNYPNLPRKYLFLEKLFSKIPDKLIAVGNEQKQTIQKTYRISSKRIMTVWNGIEKKKPAIDIKIRKLFPDDDRIIIGSLSTLIEQKGITYLLDVVSKLLDKTKNFKVLIVGDGLLRTELEKKCQKLGIEDFVFFLGWVENAASKILPVFDIFIQPSLWEAMSIVLLEAMLNGKPVVATNVGENRHVIKNGITGYLVEPKNTAQMTDALYNLISNPNIRNKVGSAAQKRIEKYFTAKHMTQVYQNIYESIL